MNEFKIAHPFLLFQIHLVLPPPMKCFYKDSVLLLTSCGMMEVIEVRKLKVSVQECREGTFYRLVSGRGFIQAVGPANHRPGTDY